MAAVYEYANNGTYRNTYKHTHILICICMYVETIMEIKKLMKRGVEEFRLQPILTSLSFWCIFKIGILERVAVTPSVSVTDNLSLKIIHSRTFLS